MGVRAQRYNCSLSASALSTDFVAGAHLADNGRVGANSDPSNGGSRLYWALPLALVVAVALNWLAPDDWESGPGLLEVRYLDAVALATPIEIGSTDPVDDVADVGGAVVAVSVPDGVGLDGPIDVGVQVDDPGLRPGLTDIEVTIITTEGAREIVPVFDAEGGHFVASRRPVVGSGIVLAVLGMAIVLWITEAVPLFVTSLAIPVLLAGAEVGTAEDALAPFFDPIIVLFFAGFLMAEAMRRSGLDRLVALSIVDVAGGGAVRLYLALIGLAAFLSMWMSNTAAVTVLVPIAM
jgi:hypothetical protein